MPQYTPLPDHLPGTFTCEQALNFGVSPRRLRGRDLKRPFRGVRSVASAVGRVDADDAEPGAIDRARQNALRRRIAEYEGVRHPTAFYTGRTALGIYGLPYAPAADAPLHVGVLLPGRAPRMRGVTGVALSPWLARVTEHDGVRVTCPASTWALVARELGERSLTVLADAIVRIPRGVGGVPEPHRRLATVEELRTAAMARHRRHREKLLGALERTRVGSMSVLESEYRLAAADAGLPEPELDVEIRGDNGRLVGIADVLYRRSRVIVEVEGDQHRTSRDQWMRDLDKYAAYAALGWEVVRVTSSHIRGDGHGVALVRSALRRRSR